MDVKIKLFGLNPLNQVYVFNQKHGGYYGLRGNGLNPLNQVYVFNPTFFLGCIMNYFSLNPLNQVYVFNKTAKKKGRLKSRS